MDTRAAALGPSKSLDGGCRPRVGARLEARWRKRNGSSSRAVALLRLIGGGGGPTILLNISW